jgi:hypothetical protein
MRSFILVAGLLVAGCASPTGIFGLGFSFLGASHYEGRAFKDLTGQFEAIAVAPVGNRVAFRGREDMNHFDLFVAELDGKVRKVAATGPSDGLIAWSADGQVLYYLDSVPRPDGLLDGATIQRYSLASDVVQQALYAVPLLSFVPSPDGSRLLVGGFTNTQVSKDPTGRSNQLLDPATGKLEGVAPGVPPLAGTWAAAWAPDGAHLALAGRAGESGQGPVTLTILAAPEWVGPPAADRTFTGTYTALAWEDAGTLRVADIVVGDELVLTRLDAEGKQLDETKITLDSPAAGTKYQYDRPLPSKDGRKVLLSRRAWDTKAYRPIGNRSFFLCKDGALQPLPTTEDLEPFGWSDDAHVVCLNGFYQERKPVILDAN